MGSRKPPAVLISALQGVEAMIQPRPTEVFSFLWQHLLKDMSVLGRSLNLNLDDTAVTVHLVLSLISGDCDSLTTFSASVHVKKR